MTTVLLLLVKFMPLLYWMMRAHFGLFPFWYSTVAIIYPAEGFRTMTQRIRI